MLKEYIKNKVYACTNNLLIVSVENVIPDDTASAQALSHSAMSDLLIPNNPKPAPSSSTPRSI